MSRTVLYILYIVFLFVQYTPVPTATDNIKEAYGMVWKKPQQALDILLQIHEPELDNEDKPLYQLTYSIASHRLRKENPYTDLSDVISHFKKQEEKSYLFVAIVQQAQLSGYQKNYKEALQLLHSCPREQPSVVPQRMLSLYHSIYGFLLYRSGDYGNAIQHYNSSQSINFAERFDDLLVSNAINMVNLPGCIDADTLDKFITLYEPYVMQADAVHQRKFYNNIGNEFKKKGDSLSAIGMYHKALEKDTTTESARSRLNYAQLLDHYGHTEQAESIYISLMRQADTTLLHRLYHHLTTRSIEQNDLSKARRYMNVYLESINNIYKTRDRRELLEIQAKYDRSELLRKAEQNRNTVLKFLLLFVAITIFSYFVYSLSRIYRCYRLGHYLGEYCQLTQAYRSVCRQAKQENQRYIQEELTYKNRIDELTGRISDLMKETNRFRTIYRIKTPYITITPQDISAMNLFLLLNGSKIKYDASQHRSTLYHWLNLTDGKFAERFMSAYPQLSQHDMDLCCFYRMGFDNDHISGLYGQYSDSIRRHRLRLYPLLAVKDKKSLYELILQF